jgi:hypothetical protein
MGKIYRIMFFVAVITSPSLSWSQTLDCDEEQTIARATEEFNAGHFYSVAGILDECRKSFTREQRQRAYLLLTQTYLLLDDPIGAQKSYLEVLLANPEFVADEQLHAIDIVYLSKKFTATPIFSWMVSAGPNVSPVRVIRDIDARSQYVNQNLTDDYYLRPGYHFGAGVEYSYNDHLNLRLGVDYVHNTFRSISEGFELDTKEFIERQSWMNVPVYISYADNIGKYRPYGYAGYALSWMLSARGSIFLENIKTRNERDAQNDEIKQVREKYEIQSADLNLIQNRNRLNQSLIFGGGLKYKIGLDFVFAEIRYCIGLKNLTSHLYGNKTSDLTTVGWIKSFEPTSAYRHVDDYFRLDNLSVSFGFLRPLYKPRELKRARTKGVLRKMNKQK